MNDSDMPVALPRAVAPLVALAPFLRRHGFAIVPEQVIAFLQGTRLAQPDSLDEMRLVARATLAPPADRLDEFDMLFRQFFSDSIDIAIAEGGVRQEQVKSLDGEIVEFVKKAPDSLSDEASTAEALAKRELDDRVDEELRQFARCWVKHRPQRRGFRSRSAVVGVIDLRKSLRDLARFDGDVTTVRRLRRQPRPRRMLILIDISGSMKKHTDDYFRLAHALIHATPKCEVMCVGTRLTNVTPMLRHRDLGTALTRAEQAVSDWDGGTRIGPSLVNLLSSTRHASFVRGALVLMLSDGLERAEPRVLVDAVGRLSLRAWKLIWATPLAGDPTYQPVTTAMRAMLCHLDYLIDGSTLQSIISNLLTINQPAPRAAEVWRQKESMP